MLLLASTFVAIGLFASSVTQNQLVAFIIAVLICFLMFYGFEKILGRPLTQKTQEGFFRIGLFLLFSLMFFVTFNDLKDLGLF